ncbi:MAG: alpha/beta hydrolase [Steroidobacteraceae bacterium]
MHLIAARSLALALLLPAAALAAQPARSFMDVVYATVHDTPLALDLYLPANERRPPLLVYLHGGAWSSGDRTQYPAFLVERGFAVASVDFRSTLTTPFPANIHDIKAAIRFLRAKSAEYGYRAERIAVAGVSSGGHLAALVGVTNGDAELEGSEGEYSDQSSDVQAIVSYYGASDLTTILAQSTPAGLEVRVPALQQLLGALPEEVPELALQASPVFHVDRGDPPLMLLHGDQDVQMPINQAHELVGAYRKAGLFVEFMVLNGAGHGGEPFFQGEAVDRVVSFLHRTIGR